MEGRGECRERGREKSVTVPTVVQLRPDLLQQRSAHVLDGQDVDEGVPLGAFLDSGEDALATFGALLGDFGGVHDLGALGLGHCGGRLACKRRRRSREMLLDASNGIEA